MIKYLLCISTKDNAKIDLFLSKKQAFKAYIKQKSNLFYDNLNNIILIKSNTINNTIYNKTIISLNKGA